MTPSSPTATFDLHGHTAIVTGANHGIGAATARVLAHCGAGVFLTYLRREQSPDSGMSDPSIGDRSSDAQHVVEGVAANGGRAAAIEADLSDAANVGLLFDAAEELLGPVDILVNNASGWAADSFRQQGELVALSATTVDQNFAVDARASALMIAEFARRAKREMGKDRWPHIGWAIGVPAGGFIRRREGGAGQLHDVRSVGTCRARDHGQHPPPSGDGYGLDHTCRGTNGSRQR